MASGDEVKESYAFLNGFWMVHSRAHCSLLRFFEITTYSADSIIPTKSGVWPSC
jgi:hypothetical protein